MRKRLSGRKFSRTTNERKRMFRNLVRSLVEQGFLVTSLAKAKSTKPLVEKLVTIARKEGLNSYRRLFQETGLAETAKQLAAYGKLFAKRPGGYTRIIRLGFQAGDNTERVRLEFVEKIEKAIVVPKTVAPKTELAAKLEQKTEKKTAVKPKTKAKKTKKQATS